MSERPTESLPAIARAIIVFVMTYVMLGVSANILAQMFFGAIETELGPARSAQVFGAIFIIVVSASAALVEYRLGQRRPPK
jgi:hypothetical protein